MRRAENSTFVFSGPSISWWAEALRSWRSFLASSSCLSSFYVVMSVKLSTWQLMSLKIISARLTISVRSYWLSSRSTFLLTIKYDSSFLRWPFLWKTFLNEILFFSLSYRSLPVSSRLKNRGWSRSRVFRTTSSFMGSNPNSSMLLLLQNWTWSYFETTICEPLLIS